MADSDDEYDRRRGRDKFRRERSDYQERRSEDRGRREDWIDRGRESWSRERGRRGYREYDPRRRERYSPPRHDMSPPMKKMRRDWDDRGFSGFDVGYGNSPNIASHQNWGGGGGFEMGPNPNLMGGFGAGPRDPDIGPTQPPMMTFKQFLASQDDGISDEEAVRKYNEYKLEFKCHQLNEFFLNHKEEEWFKSKYHPEECGKKRAEQLNAIHRRVEVFTELRDKGWLDTISIDIDKENEIIRLLDAVVIKLEGGSDLDLKVLDATQEEKPEKSEQPLVVSVSKQEQSDKNKSLLQPSYGPPASDSPEHPSKKSSSPPDLSAGKAGEGEKKKKIRNKEFNFDENEDNISESDSDVETDQLGNAEQDVATPAEEKAEDVPRDEDSSNDGDAPSEEHVNGDEDTPKETLKEMDEADSKGKSDDFDKTAEPKKVVTESPPRLLHKTCSIFLRNLAPTITKQEVEAMCRRYPGFLRVAIADPQPERRFLRRGWVTFERNVNIKEICWNLNNIRLRDCELGATVNRDLTRRIRAWNGIAAHKPVVKADVKLAARIIQNLDGRHDLWSSTADKQDDMPSFGMMSRNPLLKNITDYLIEEASAEEEELLGTSETDEDKSKEETGNTTLERDETLIKVLDCLLVYLRIVHSVDYYNHSDYPNEDEMPNRCGILHARGSPPANRVTEQEVKDYIATFEIKTAPFFRPPSKLTQEEALRLGLKDAEVEVEKFIQVNTQELAKDKWLCPLSGKKFKGPEFVRKHIFNKHSEKIEEVRKEVEYFNNYLMDPKRPQLPEHPGNRIPSGGPMLGSREPYMSQMGYQPPPQFGFGGYGQGARAHQGPGFSQGFGGRGVGYGESFRNTGSPFYGPKRGAMRSRGDPREIVGYQDLDAPDDMDLF